MRICDFCKKNQASSIVITPMQDKKTGEQVEIQEDACKECLDILRKPKGG